MTTAPKILCRIGARGQITLPADMLKRLGLKPGDHMDVQEEGNRIVLIPAPPLSAPGV